MTESAKESVLVIDDDEAARYVKVRALRSAGFETLESSSGLEGVELARSERPDLVLLDIKLPDIDGFEVCARLRSEATTAHLSIIQVSATFETAEFQVRGLEGGADTYLVWPVEPAVLVATARAIIRMRRAEAQMRDFDRRKDNFLAMLSHELRGPLAPLRYSLDLLAEQAPASGPVQDVVVTMRRQVDHLKRLVDDLVDIRRINESKLTLQRERISLREVVGMVVDSFRVGMEEMGHELSLDFPQEDVELYADRVRLVQAIGNLLSNSIKYTPPGGRIAIAAWADETDVVVSVSDTGIGLAKQDVPRVFDMFVQVTGTSGGLGIGLALVRNIVEMHGGSVEVRSAGIGHGSTFVVTLPLLAGPPAQDAEPAPAPQGRVLKVLVVDDNVDAADMLAALVRALGHEAQTRYAGAEAVAAADAFRPDVVFMDITMPDVNGLEAVRQVRAHQWSGETLFCTISGHGRAADRERSAEAGVDVHLVKPVDSDTLKRILARAGSRRPE